MSGPPTSLDEHLGDAQWYYHRARQSVYFTAFSGTAISREQLHQSARAFVAHAPQLLAGFDPDFLDNSANLDALIDIFEVDDLSVYPDAWQVNGEELFDQPHLPPFRIEAAISSSGPDADGRAASILVLATHALLEGSDSARLTRSNLSRHLSEQRDATSPGQPLLTLTTAALVPVQLLLANLIGPKKGPRGQKSLTLDRHRVRELARRFGVSQRAFLFALVSFGINGDDHAISPKRIFINFTNLSPGGADPESYFRFHVMEAKLPLKPDFAEFAKTTEQVLMRTDAKGPAFSQAFVDRLFHLHRKLAGFLPFLYPTRFFQFAGFFDLNLSITPPHHLGGPLTRSLMEPIFAGTFHPGLNSCVFVPQKSVITLNFEMQTRLLGRVNAVQNLFESL
ncbi:MAG: hypothetical protein KDJ19_08610 [Hyphomicrobiaceae bacterium]|nr:hypothetical protein [Hyphomicrobiaceae bacterium]MCC0024298.1 hypothetical protein [Hyphomicrobiaceae bacterium]